MFINRHIYSTCLKQLALLLLSVSFSFIVAAQGISDKTIQDNTSFFSRLQRNIQSADKAVVSRLQRSEERMLKKLQRKDSTAAKRLQQQSQQEYAQLQQTLNSRDTGNAVRLKEYMPHLDSLQTAAAFLSTTPGASGVTAAGYQQLNQQLKGVQSSLQQSNDISAFIQQRQQLLKDQLQQYGLLKELKSLQKEGYYYRQQIQQYKDFVNDPDKAGKEVLVLVQKTGAFQNFMSKHGQLAALFGLSAGEGSGMATAMPGFQSRDQVNQLLQQQLGSGGTDAQAMLRSNVQEGQASLNVLKDKADQLGGGSSDIAMPDGFTPNKQRSKTFWQRLEYGVNLQSQGSSNLLPSISDIGLSLGFRISDRAVTGIGASYKLGWGQPVSHIRFSSEGVGLRSFIDIKAKGSIWLTGGYEQNYLQSFTKLVQLHNAAAWQHSGLLGLTKKYRVGKKQGNLQLLWDFLSYSQQPAAKPFVFRVGYTL